MFYLIKTPWWLKKLYPLCIWDIPVKDKVIYLTFDDGPHPEITPFVLDTLASYNAKATFFCIGKNVQQHPDVYHNILTAGHRTGNHTFNHLNGWKTDDEKYLQNIAEAAKYIDSNLFRPPYGRITKFQSKLLTQPTETNNGKPFNIIMWDVLSADFDTSLSAEKCVLNVIGNTRPGSIVVFHDSEKAFPRMKEALPKMLQYFTEKGYRFVSIPS
ncbi:MAG: polysaccharide deacetylase family protein [Chitinophagaceae bacterium]